MSYPQAMAICSCVVQNASQNPTVEPFLLFDRVEPKHTACLTVPLVLTAYVSKPGLQPGQLLPKRGLFPVHDKFGEPWSLVLTGSPTAIWYLQQRHDGQVQLRTPQERLSPQNFTQAGNPSRSHPAIPDVSAPLSFGNDSLPSSSLFCDQSAMPVDNDSRETCTPETCAHGGCAHNLVASHASGPEIHSDMTERSHVGLGYGRGDASDQQIIHTNKRESLNTAMEPRKRRGIRRFLPGWLQGNARRGAEANQIGASK
ncbi:hypothetical protein NLI96_g184 [Meripilus lineatus]|uniref:Uncharacterized protein n=1 Tax=Meripilus lineatus TaxID=2056292 RepID=A0AAD5VCW5_9APHY|nr:hypothetical protein NLI96_g184 [Physisporinus lineatus]